MNKEEFFKDLSSVAMKHKICFEAQAQIPDPNNEFVHSYATVMVDGGGIIMPFEDGVYLKTVTYDSECHKHNGMGKNFMAKLYEKNPELKHD